MGKTWRKERYESDENSSRSFSKGRKRYWVEQEIIDELIYDLAAADIPEDELEESDTNK